MLLFLLFFLVVLIIIGPVDDHTHVAVLYLINLHPHKLLLHHFLWFLKFNHLYCFLKIYYYLYFHLIIGHSHHYCLTWCFQCYLNLDFLNCLHHLKNSLWFYLQVLSLLKFHQLLVQHYLWLLKFNLHLTNPIH